MTRNPCKAESRCYNRIKDRIGRVSSSKWDEKIHEQSKLNFFTLRYRVGMATVDGRNTVTEVCRMFHVSRGFVGKWSSVYRDMRYNNKVCVRDGRTSVKWCKKDVFKSISNRPKYVEAKIRDGIRNAVKKMRLKYPFLGSAKIKAMCNLDVSCSTIDKVIREEGLMSEPKKRMRNKTYGSYERKHSFSMVQIDYKTWPGGFHSIWVIDDASRFILGHRVEKRQSAEDVIDLLEKTFSFWNVWPKQILSDHGSEFYSVNGGRGASKLDRWCGEHGIEHIMGRVRHPQTQGKIERSHLSAKREMPAFGKMDTLENAKRTISGWVGFYNTERTHQSLEQKTPFDAFIEKLDGDFLDSFLSKR